MRWMGWTSLDLDGPNSRVPVPRLFPFKVLPKPTRPHLRSRRQHHPAGPGQNRRSAAAPRSQLEPRDSLRAPNTGLPETPLFCPPAAGLHERQSPICRPRSLVAVEPPTSSAHHCTALRCARLVCFAAAASAAAARCTNPNARACSCPRPETSSFSLSRVDPDEATKPPPPSQELPRGAPAQPSCLREAHPSIPRPNGLCAPMGDPTTDHRRALPTIAAMDKTKRPPVAAKEHVSKPPPLQQADQRREKTAAAEAHKSPKKRRKVNHGSSCFPLPPSSLSSY